MVNVIVFYAICILLFFSIVFVFVLFYVKQYIDNYDKKVQQRKEELERFFKKDEWVEIDTDSKIDILATCEYIVEHIEKQDFSKQIEKYKLADKIYEFYTSSFTNFYKHYFISILIELRTKEYANFFKQKLKSQNINNEEAGYYLYALAILKNNYDELVSLYKLVQDVYQRHQISQLFCELVISEAFENTQEKDIKKFFNEFLINEDVTDTFISAIKSMDERKDINWQDTIKLFTKKSNPKIDKALAELEL